MDPYNLTQKNKAMIKKKKAIKRKAAPKRKIGAAGDYAKFETATIKALAKLLKKPLKSVQKGVNENPGLLKIIGRSFDNKLTPTQTAKELKKALQPIVEKDPKNAFVQLLEKISKGKKKAAPAKSAAFPMKLPATVTIGSAKGHFNSIAELKEANKKIGHFFFSPNTMKAFKTKICTPMILGRYFITREQSPIGNIFFIREATQRGEIINDPFKKEFPNLKEAKNYLQKKVRQ